MSTFGDVLTGRRSIRKDEDKTIPDELLGDVLNAVKWSPSWANTQCWEIIVIKDSARKEQLQSLTLTTNPAWESIAGAPVVLAICAKLGTSGFYKDRALTKFGDWYMFDMGLATQSLCLAAYEQGLGTVVVVGFDHDKARELLAVPPGHELVAIIPMGYPAETLSAPKRREPAEYVHNETF
ncbi:MAG: nitroreductase family protein [Deltaproteobacteria bacterium]|nr:nitroreductase family protein [Deltaproteobacteria bacterium]